MRQIQTGGHSRHTYAHYICRHPYAHYICRHSRTHVGSRRRSFGHRWPPHMHYSMCMYMRMSTTHLVIVGHHTCCGTLQTHMRTLHLHSLMHTCSLDQWATWPTRLRPQFFFFGPRGHLLWQVGGPPRRSLGHRWPPHMHDSMCMYMCMFMCM